MLTFLGGPVTAGVIVSAGCGERLDAVAGVCRGGPGGREAALPSCYVVQLAGAPSSSTTTLSPCQGGSAGLGAFNQPRQKSEGGGGV